MDNTIAMNDHALKTTVSVILGYIASWHYVAQVGTDPGMWAAIFRSILVGAAAWGGQTGLKYISKIIVHKWKNRRK